MRLKALVVGLAALGATALTTGASAMPNGLPQAGQIAGQTANVDQVRWVCTAWGRCWHRPNFYGAYGYYGYHRPWGWHRWHRW
ncbi:hypothetical protein [Bradyrhizobium sp.]|uniref:hypothetical protein n=1 Tax=Bradyrhizobium sp. TaxID=376 RepID=UPI0025B7D966|nr:hypothetical protein [Bradyrhizobium sp.]MBV8920204.1 hypothetical protein [Bradyrhizobium sp.]